MAPAPHLVQALQDAHRLGAEQDEAAFKAIEAQTQRVLERLGDEDVDPAYTDLAESEGPLGHTLDPDAVDFAVASLTALEEQPDVEQAELALRALTDLEDALPGTPGPGSHPGR